MTQHMLHFIYYDIGDRTRWARKIEFAIALDFVTKHQGSSKAAVMAQRMLVFNRNHTISDEGFRPPTFRRERPSHFPPSEVLPPTLKCKASDGVEDEKSVKRAKSDSAAGKTGGRKKDSEKRWVSGTNVKVEQGGAPSHPLHSDKHFKEKIKDVKTGERDLGGTRRTAQMSIAKQVGPCNWGDGVLDSRAHAPDFLDAMLVLKCAGVLNEGDFGLNTRQGSCELRKGNSKRIAVVVGEVVYQQGGVVQVGNSLRVVRIGVGGRHLVTVIVEGGCMRGEIIANASLRSVLMV
ncbi:hypothetical protein B0H13DRAFT_1856441 [Mycena leptocephala]|nr:hypothetical protein B0H13DRAFT_1856441 [Mycena leptocephala]